MGSAVPRAGGARCGVTRASPSPPPHGAQQVAPRARRWRRTGTGTGRNRGEPGGTGGSYDGPDWAGLGLLLLGYTGLTARDFTGLCWSMKSMAGLGCTGLYWSLDWDSFLPPGLVPHPEHQFPVLPVPSPPSPPGAGDLGQIL